MDKIDYPNRTSVHYLYDQANRIKQINNKLFTADITKHVYEYDQNGNRLKLTESNIHDNQVIDYTYDKADRLRTVEYPNNNKTEYVLDKVGNRTSEIITGINPNTKVYSYNNRDQLTNITDDLGANISYSYDQAGNQLTKDENGIMTTFDYTPRHRVGTITVGAGQPINYAYDFTGQRIRYRSQGLEKRYLYDGLTLIGQTNVIGNTIARYHYGDRYQLAETREELTNSYFHVDSLGTNVAVTTVDATLAARYEYDAYGNLLTQSGASDNPFGFTGYQKDDETDLYYANARYYDSNTGRFLRNDPLDGNVQDPPSFHRYLYASSNPTSFVDPTGKGNDTAHYYDALLIGSLVGLSEFESAAFALGAQIGDEFQQADAVQNSISFGLTKAFLDRSNQSSAEAILISQSLREKVINNCGNHALCNTRPEFLRDAVTDYVANNVENFFELGTADHAFTDSFFHIRKDQVNDLEKQQLQTPIIGHTWEVHDTDKAFLYHGSKRVKAFEARAWLVYKFTVKKGTQTMSPELFEKKIKEATMLLDDQHNQLLSKHRKLGFTEGGVYTWTTDFGGISDEEEFNMMRSILKGLGFNNIPRTERHSLARNVNGLLGDYTHEQLVGIIIATNPKLDEQMVKGVDKSQLIKYINGKLFQAQEKSRDAIYEGIVQRRASHPQLIKEEKDAPGVKELWQ